MLPSRTLVQGHQMLSQRPPPYSALQINRFVFRGFWAGQNWSKRGQMAQNGLPIGPDLSTSEHTFQRMVFFTRSVPVVQRVPPFQKWGFDGACWMCDLGKCQLEHILLNGKMCVSLSLSLSISVLSSLLLFSLSGSIFFSSLVLFYSCYSSLSLPSSSVPGSP